MVWYVACRYGEIVNINLVRDKKTGKSKGFCFLAYEDQRSTVLAVDNLNGFKVSVHNVPKTLFFLLSYFLHVCFLPYYKECSAYEFSYVPTHLFIEQYMCMY